MSQHEQQSGIWKDADSPAGHGFYAPIDHSGLYDCPVCRYGTPISHGKEKGYYCGDCGAGPFTGSELKTYQKYSR
jgi:hypothetical protein